MRTAAIYQLEQALPRYIIDAGVITDELESSQMGASLGILLSGSVPPGGSLDERILPELTRGSGTSADNDYTALQAVRGSIAQALGGLATYDTAVADTITVKIMRSELYALDGYTEILLADLFCSGVPLSTFNFGKDFTYHASSTKEQVYQAAIAQEDSALALAGSSNPVRYLALVLKGRGLLDLGGASNVAQAAQVVAAVPDGFQYQLAAQWGNVGAYGIDQIHANGDSLSDWEGLNGLPYLSSSDPRTTPVILNGTLFPAKYQAGIVSVTAFAPFTVADAVEARLIQAEAALRANASDLTWLTILNALRTNGVFTTASDPTNPAVPDTTWNAGSAGVAGLKAFRDPGTDTARVSLLFQERAYWLYLTGHRQGDLRRLIRQYHRSQEQVYPMGPYTAPGEGQYGNDVTVPIPVAERVNPLFHGCLNRDA